MCAFKITGPGKYLTRGGREVNVVLRLRQRKGTVSIKIWPWMDQNEFTYRTSGHWQDPSAPVTHDIVAKVRAPERKHRPKQAIKKEKILMRKAKDYVVGKANGIYRIFEVRKTKRLGLTTTSYYMEHPRKDWPKFKGTIRDKSPVLHNRDEARRVRTLKNEGRV